MSFYTSIILGGAERFLTDFHQAVEMMNVDVYEHPVQTCQDLFIDRDKRFGKGNVVLHGKYGLVVNLTLDPVHQVRYVLKLKRQVQLKVK